MFATFVRQGCKEHSDRLSSRVRRVQSNAMVRAHVSDIRVFRGTLCPCTSVLLCPAGRY
jgi:hypothetical protein